jgi:NitT/TauT family transport system substrate-binding protein
MKQDFLQPSISRRHFLSGSAALAGISWLGSSQEARAEPPPEMTTIRLEDFPAICIAPQYLAEEFLYAEGFSKVEYVTSVANMAPDPGRVDISMVTAAALIVSMDSDPPLISIAGIHSGCQVLFGNERVRTIRDLKGKSVAISAIGSGEQISVSSVAAYVGIDPRKDIDWIVGNTSEGALQLFMDGKADAYWAFEPQPHFLLEKRIGHPILNTTEDKPWSQYFCCLLPARREFVRRYPVATKRALRAFLKATDLCTREPERVARLMKENGRQPRYELSLEVLKKRVRKTPCVSTRCGCTKWA